MPANPSTTTKGLEVWTVDCTPECGFRIREHNPKELVKLVQMHLKDTHNQNMSEKDVLAKAVASRL